jgi:hypothetical protein
MSSQRAAEGLVYLLHFSEPYQHARHYTGWTHDLDARLQLHRAGRGARLLPLSLVSTTMGSFQSQFPVCALLSSGALDGRKRPSRQIPSLANARAVSLLAVAPASR